MEGRGGKRRGRPRYTVLDISKREEKMETEPKTEEEQHQATAKESRKNSMRTKKNTSRFEEPDDPEFEKECFGGEKVEERRGRTQSRRREKSMDYHQFVKVTVFCNNLSIL